MSNRPITPLGRKIVAAILGTTLLALVLSFVLNLLPTVYAYRDSTADKARAQAELMAVTLAAAVDFNDAIAASEDLATLSLVPNVSGAAVYVGENDVFAEYGVSPSYRSGDVSTIEQGISELIVVSPINSQQQGASVVIAVSLGGQWGVVQSYLLTGAVILVVVFFLSARIAGRFRRKLGDPLEELTDAVRTISRSKDYTNRVDYESDDEVGVLIAEFNEMLEKVAKRDAQLGLHSEQLEETVAKRTEQLQVKQHELLHNNRLLLNEIKKRAQAEMIREEVERINRHDLKSSLSLVIGYPELLLQGGNLSLEQEKKVKRIRAAGYRMLDMIRNHLNMFKMENGIYSLNKGQVDLVEVVCSLEEEFAPLIESSGVRLGVEIDGQEVVGDEEFIVIGEAPLMRTMLRNMIQNGIEASSRGDKVTVSFQSKERKTLTVANPTVVPREVRRRFFDKYVTHGKENGTGLGTYIVSLIARTHGANVTMNSNETSGTALRVAFRDGAGLVEDQPAPMSDH